MGLRPRWPVCSEDVSEGGRQGAGDKPGSIQPRNTSGTRVAVMVELGRGQPHGERVKR